MFQVCKNIKNNQKKRDKIKKKLPFFLFFFFFCSKYKLTNLEEFRKRERYE